MATTYYYFTPSLDTFKHLFSPLLILDKRPNFSEINGLISLTLFSSKNTYISLELIQAISLIFKKEGFFAAPGSENKKKYR